MNIILNVDDLLGFILVFLITFLFAFAELISRYKHVKRLISSSVAWFYMILNSVFGLFTYLIIREYDIAALGVVDNIFLKGIIAGLLSATVLRSSFANIKFGDANISAGLGFIIQTILSAADRAYDQERSLLELKEMREIMSGMDIDHAIKDLPVLCLRIMNNVPYDEQAKLADAVVKISEEDDLQDDTKLLILGFTLCKITNLRLLKEAVHTMKKYSRGTEDKYKKQVQRSEEKRAELMALLEEINADNDEH